jgi:hypothetical protein
MPSDKYLAHLASDKWRSLCQRVRYRCRNICEGCGLAEVTEVHHLTYKHLGDEFLFQLLGLCRNCHARLHGRQP